MNLLPLLMCGAMLVATGRMLFYRRDGARFRRHYSILAWLVMLCLVSSALGLLLGGYHDVPRGMSLLMLLLCARIWRDKGNVARLFGGGRW